MSGEEKKHDWNKFIAIVAAITAIVSVIISTISLYYTNERSIEQIELTRNHNRLSVQPIITSFVRINPDRPKSGLGYKNNGFGPAKIVEIKFAIDGKWVQARDSRYTQDKVMNQLGIDNKAIGYGGFQPGGVFKEDSEKWVFFSRNTTDFNTASGYLKTIMNHIGIYVCYCSLYNDCTTQVDGKVPKQLPECKGASDL